MANQDEIEFECPRCLELNRVHKSLAGQRTDCSSCKGSLLVPSQVAGGNAFEDIFADPVKPAVADEQPTGGTSVPSGKPDSIPVVNSPAESNDDLLHGISVPEASDVEDNPLAGADPFEVDPDAKIKIDGIADIFGHDDVYGFKCKICDTRIHVRPDQANTHVECPECYSKVLVLPPPKNANPSQRWVKEGRDKTAKSSGEDELKLSDPIKRPKIEIDESYGLEAPQEDLLAPKQPAPTAYDEAYDLEEIDERRPTTELIAGRTLPTDDSETPNRKSPPSSSKKPKSKPGNRTRREIYEEAQRRQQHAETDTVFNPGDSAKSKKSFPSFEFSALLAATIQMLRSPGLLWRVVVAVGLMLFGTIAMEAIYPQSGLPAGDEDASMAQRLMRWANWGIVGGIPYLLGVLMLWFTAGYVFRDAALGHRQVKSWKNAGSAELMGTFLVFGFGFFIGGLPALFLVWLIMPLRVMLAPLLLLGAWFSRSPFSIVNVDAFKNAGQQASLWFALYRFLAVLAFFGFISGVLYAMRGIEGTAFAVSILMTVPAVLIATATTLAFAAVCGWHCGRVVEHLEDPQ